MPAPTETHELALVLPLLLTAFEDEADPIVGAEIGVAMVTTVGAATEAAG